MQDQPTPLFGGYEPRWEGIEAEFGHWLAGFVDGEGCFALVANGRGGVRCLFKISLRNDDGDILAEIHERLGIGSIVRNKVIVDGNPQAEWVVSAKAHCLQLIGLFRRYPLRAKKARDFEIWARAVELWAASFYQGKRGEDYRELHVLMMEMRRVRAYPIALGRSFDDVRRLVG